MSRKLILFQLIDFSDKFQVNTDNNKIIITANDIISEEELEKKKYILMILEAEYDGAEKIGKTVILLDIVGDTGNVYIHIIFNIKY